MHQSKQDAVDSLRVARSDHAHLIVLAAGSLCSHVEILVAWIPADKAHRHGNLSSELLSCRL